MNLEAPEGSLRVSEVRIPVYVLVFQGEQMRLIRHEMEKVAQKMMQRVAQKVVQNHQQNLSAGENEKSL